VIADSTRREILRVLLQRDQQTEDGTSVSQIVGELSVTQPTVSKHLKVLRDVGLVTVREEG
jgi:DNA-binding transcriptional ArsR family regulator